MTAYPKKVKIVEVGPRDGLQNEKDTIQTSDKIKFIDLLTESGLSVIEATSFVSPKWVPQLSDASQVFINIRKPKNVFYPVLVPNVKGLERAVLSGVKHIAVFTAASETFTQKNINMSVDDSLKTIAEVTKQAARMGLWVRGYVSTSFVCPYEGRVAPEKVLSVVSRLLDLGVNEISLGDTIGAAVPTQVEAVLEQLLPVIASKSSSLGMHFHDTRGTALANILKSLEMGITIVDSSAGGLGGCPYAPGASGNVATEDVLYMLHKMGIETGVSLEKVAEASRFMSTVLSRPLPSKYLQSCRG
jgi:hydroxymethylglutaryl-CoA lyase